MSIGKLAIACFVAAASLIAGCRSMRPGALEFPAQARQSPSVLAGCYRHTVGAWTPPLRAQDWPASQTPPPEFELDPTIVSGWPSADTVWTVRPAALVSRRHIPASWRYVRPDSVNIVWSTGFTGVYLRLRIVGDTLRGQATTFRDAHIKGEPPDPRASVVAVRHTCGAR